MSEPIVPLSDEQRDFVAEHHNLIYSFANQRNIDLEEFYGVLAMALCRAAQSYDESKGTFSTYAYIWMDSYLKRYWLTEYRKMRRAPSEPVSLNEYVNSDDGNETELQDILDDPSITTRLDETAVIIDEFLKTLTPDQRTLSTQEHGLTWKKERSFESIMFTTDGSILPRADSRSKISKRT